MDMLLMGAQHLTDSNSYGKRGVTSCVCLKDWTLGNNIIIMYRSLKCTMSVRNTESEAPSVARGQMDKIKRKRM